MGNLPWLHISPSNHIWLVVSIPLTHISQWDGLSHILWKTKNVWNHQPNIINLHIRRFIFRHIPVQKWPGTLWPMRSSMGPPAKKTCLKRTPRALHKEASRWRTCMNFSSRWVGDGTLSFKKVDGNLFCLKPLHWGLKEMGHQKKSPFLDEFYVTTVARTSVVPLHCLFNRMPNMDCDNHQYIG